MNRLFPFLLISSTLMACSNVSHETADSAVVSKNFVLVSMDGYEASLSRDIKILGREAIKDTVLKVNYSKNGEIAWSSINIGNCVKFRNNPSGLWQDFHRCTMVVKKADVEFEYAPYALTEENFVEKIEPQITEQKIMTSGQLVWLNSGNEEIARFHPMEVAQ